MHRVRLGKWIEELGGEAPTPAGGALALVTLAGAAALVGKVARLAGRGPDPFPGLARGLLAAADEDARGYPRARSGGGDPARAFLARGADRVEEALVIVRAARELRGRVGPEVAADLEAAEGLARRAAEVLLSNLEVNLSAWAGRIPDPEPLAARLEGLRSRWRGP